MPKELVAVVLVGPSTIFTGVSVEVAATCTQPTLMVDVAALVVGMLSAVAMVEEACMVALPVSVEAPVTLRVPAVAKFPFEAVVVANPFTLTLPLSQLTPELVCRVEDALVKAACPAIVVVIVDFPIPIEVAVDVPIYSAPPLSVSIELPAR